MEVVEPWRGYARVKKEYAKGRRVCQPSRRFVEALRGYARAREDYDKGKKGSLALDEGRGALRKTTPRTWRTTPTLGGLRQAFGVLEELRQALGGSLQSWR